MTIKLTADILEGFVGSVLAKRFDGGTNTPWFHREWWELCTGKNRFVAIAAPRYHAKTTAITFSYLLAAMLFRERKYGIIVSDSEGQASVFLNNIKQELKENKDLAELFGLTKNANGEVEFLKDSETDVIVSFTDGHTFRLVAKGSEQKLRGLLWNHPSGLLRPDIIICDDMENDELVMNPERRLKFKRWFNAALIPMLADNGVVRVVGTILHMDSLLENLMPIPHDKMSVQEPLKLWSRRRSMWVGVKYAGHTSGYEELLWPQKKSVEAFKAYREQCVRDGIPEVYSQEILNIPIAEENAYFRRSDFLPMRDDDKKATVRYYCTVDLAISSKQTADYSVFLIAAVDEDKRIQVRNVIRDRLDGRDIVNTLLALQKTYNFEAVGIEESQISQSIGPFLRESMIASNIYLNVYPLKHMGMDKTTRARSIQARCRAKGVKVDKNEDWFPAFEDECLKFPRDKHDDQVDAFAYLGMMLDKLVEAPTVKELQDEAYEEELEQSQFYEQGRNGTTGY